MRASSLEICGVNELETFIQIIPKGGVGYGRMEFRCGTYTG